MFIKMKPDNSKFFLSSLSSLGVVFQEPGLGFWYRSLFSGTERELGKMGKDFGFGNAYLSMRSDHLATLFLVFCVVVSFKLVGVVRCYYFGLPYF